MSRIVPMVKGATPRHRWICWWMLVSRRQYVIDKIKKPLKKAIKVLALRYPEPTKETTSLPRTHILIDIASKFMEHEKNPLLHAIWRMFIVEYEHDFYYRDRIDWVIEELQKSDWWKVDQMIESTLDWDSET